MKETRTNEDFVIASEYQALNLLANVEEDLKFTKSLFPHKEAKNIFEAIQLLRDRKEHITESTLFRESNALNSEIDNVLIHTIFTYKTDISSKDSILEHLKEASTKYQVKELSEKIVDITSSPEPLDQQAISNLLYEAQESLVNGQKKTLAKTLETCFEEYNEELDERLKGLRYTFGDAFMDKMLTRKASPGQAILIAGTTGTGKSAFTLYLINGMINMGIPCMYFSLEMDGISTMDRLLAMRTGIPVEEWYEPANINSLRRKMDREKDLLKDKPFRFIEDASLGLDQLQVMIREFKMTYKTSYACIYIDLITQVRDFTNLKGAGTLANTIEFAVNRLNALAKSENVCFVCVAQLNRETDSQKVSCIEDIETYRPTLNQIKNSNALGERSRVVLSVFRPKYYAERLFPDNEEVDLMNDVLEVQVMKQNQGGVGSISKYMFDGPCFQIKPFIESEESSELGNISY